MSRFPYYLRWWVFVARLDSPTTGGMYNRTGLVCKMAEPWLVWLLPKWQRITEEEAAKCAPKSVRKVEQMKLKTVTVPRGYDGLHVEVPGCIVNISTNSPGPKGEPMTSVSVEVQGDRYAGDPEWWAMPGGIEPKGCGVRVLQRKKPEKVPIEIQAQEWERSLVNCGPLKTHELAETLGALGLCIRQMTPTDAAALMVYLAPRLGQTAYLGDALRGFFDDTLARADAR